MYYPPGYRPASQPAPVITPTVRGCLVEGCSCRDARILSYRKLEFFRALAKQRGQTLERVVPVGNLSALLVRPDGPENVESEETAIIPAPDGRLTQALNCVCSCNCENVQTITYANHCRECLSGSHARA